MFIVLGLYSQIWYLFLYQYAPPVWSPCNPTNREVAQLSNDAMGAARLIPMGSNQNSAVALSSRNDMMSILQRSVRTSEGRQRNSDFKLLCHGWFHYVRHHVHDGHYTGEFATVIWRLDSFTVSFRGDVGGESGLRELASVNRRTSQWARGRFIKTILPAWLEKWRHIKFRCMCKMCSSFELRFVSLIYDAQNMQNW